MNTFIDHIIDYIKPKYGTDYSKLCIVFPTRRACLIFRNKLANSHNTPVWAPTIQSIGDFINKNNSIKVSEEIPLLISLFEIYRKHWPDQDFGKYYSWGKMLLNDFDEIDKQLHEPSFVFKNINELRKLESAFLPDVESMKWIETFLASINEQKLTRLQKEFTDNWNRLEKMYIEYNSLLDEKNMAYEGKAYRLLINELQSGKRTDNFEQFIFAGFYGFSKAEERVIQLLQKHNNVQLFWDADPWYINNNKHEAGYYFRRSEFTKHSFDWNEDQLRSKDKNIEIISVPLKAGQAKYTGELLETLSKSGKIDINTTAIVLPDEDMLFPVLQSIPENLDPINVTMGYPLKNSYFSNFFDVIFDVQKNYKVNKNGGIVFIKHFVDQVIFHPLVTNFIKNTKPLKPSGHFSTLNASDITELYKFSFSELFFLKIETTEEQFNNITKIVSTVVDALQSTDNTASQYEIKVLRFLNAEIDLLKEQLGEHLSEITVATGRQMIKEMIDNMKIPFSGEPVKGLQIMGFLETRALDFETLIILNLNEGILPKSSQPHSFIPYSLRKAFGLNTFDDMEASFSYHFYRLFHKATNIYLISNSEVGKMGGGEKSRYLLQIQYELKKYMGNKLNLSHKTVNTPVIPHTINPISIDKTPEINAWTEKFKHTYTDKDKRSFSSSALTTYINCGLQYYFKYIAGLGEPEKSTKYMEAVDLGNILHIVMEVLYRNVSGPITEELLDKIAPKVDKTVEQVINDNYKVPYDQLSGNDIINSGVIKELAKRILKSDRSTVPFTIESLEDTYSTLLECNETKYRLYGKFDRVDIKDGITRIIDYKTGNVELKAKEIEELFKQPKKKTLFQLYFYSLLYNSNFPEKKFKSGFYVARNLGSGISYPVKEIDNQELTMFKSSLSSLITEIVNPNVPFRQTDEQVRCTYCAYKNICNRQTND